MKKQVLLLILATGLLIACGNNSTNAPTSTGHFTDEQLATHDKLLSKQQFQSPVSIALAILNDITGSYRLNPESLDFDVLYKAMPSCPGRVVLAYGHINEDSYDPLIRLNHIPQLLIETPKSNKKINPWIQSETMFDNNVYNHVNTAIDSLNKASLAIFSSKVADKLNRNTARRSDVVFALKRASTLLNEFSGCPRFLIVCSDFKDTFGRSMNLDSSINLYVVGSNVDSRDVKAATGIGSGYRLFESYEEALHQISQQYMYNLKK
ncbi:MAG: hypothetical protein LBI82_04705 [Dysgonamonadaceae bacterium]|jgi:hypothetical protein|nr:hypothetical protein [Dysgonamonadaceae bacterium]